MSTPKIKMIKQDALIKIEIGTGFLQKIQHLLLYITEDITPEQIEVYKKIIEEGKEFTEDWMDALNTISFLLREIENQADKQGFIFETDIDSLPSPETPITEDN